jgi:hypothetical protein
MGRPWWRPWGNPPPVYRHHTEYVPNNRPWQGSAWAGFVIILVILIVLIVLFLG